MSRTVLRAALLGVACLAVGLGSCDNPRETRLPETGATLEGTVKYGNDQLQFAQVQVLGADKMATGRIDEEGRYRVDNCPTGDVKIGVNTMAAMGEYRSKTMQGGLYKGPEAKGKGKVNLRFIDVPEKYADPNKSGIRTTVNSGSNTYDIVIPR